jgi:Ni/Co efflux regulator RcnB
MKPQKDVLQVTISDLHSGSNYALFLPHQWSGRNGMTHTPTPLQKRIEEHKNFFCDVIAQRRKGAKLILVHNGDGVEGDHHNSADVCTTNELEQAEIHIEIMEDIKKRMGWERGDELHYTRGTKTHVKHWESYIADQLNADISERLELKINGRLFVWSHPLASAQMRETHYATN